jgi:hypothetical protein
MKYDLFKPSQRILTPLQNGREEHSEEPSLPEALTKFFLLHEPDSEVR